MNYKTIIICAFLTGSMQHAWGMEESAQETAQRETEWTYGGWILNTTREDEAFNTAQLKKTALIVEELDLLESGSNALIAAKQACDEEGINLRETQVPEFAGAAQAYRSSLGTHHSKNPDALALKISTALETYRKNRTNNSSDNNQHEGK